MATHIVHLAVYDVLKACVGGQWRGLHESQSTSYNGEQNRLRVCLHLLYGRYQHSW